MYDSQIRDPHHGATTIARITVANDNPDFLDAMHDLLEELGPHDVSIINGDHAAVPDIVATNPELLIVDLRLGEGTLKGWDLAVLVRAHDELRAVPMIVCSGDVRTLRERQAEFLSVGGIHILEKPFGIEMLGGS